MAQIKAQESNNFLSRFMESIGGVLYPYLDKLFHFRPLVWFYIWPLAVAGYAAANSTLDSNLFWEVGFDPFVALFFMGLTLVHLAGSLAKKVLNDDSDVEGDIVDSNAPISPTVGLVLLAIGLLMIIPSGFIAVLGAMLIYSTVAHRLFPKFNIFRENNRYSEVLVVIINSSGAYISGWGASGVSIDLIIQFATPYIIGVTAIAILSSLCVHPIFSHGVKPKNGTILLTSSAIATLLILWATYLGYQNGDPVIPTTAVLTLPFLIITMIYRRRIDNARAVRYALLIFIIFVSARYPLLIAPILALFYSSRYYYKKKSGFIFPSFSFQEFQET